MFIKKMTLQTALPHLEETLDYVGIPILGSVGIGTYKMLTLLSKERVVYITNTSEKRKTADKIAKAKLLADGISGNKTKVVKSISNEEEAEEWRPDLEILCDPFNKKHKANIAWIAHKSKKKFLGISDKIDPLKGEISTWKGEVNFFQLGQNRDYYCENGVFLVNYTQNPRVIKLLADRLPTPFFFPRSWNEKIASNIIQKLGAGDFLWVRKTKITIVQTKPEEAKDLYMKYLAHYFASEKEAKDLNNEIDVKRKGSILDDD